MIPKMIPKYRKKPRRESIARTWTPEKYREELAIKRPDIIALEDYKGARIATYHQSLVCQHVWKARPDNILHGKDCPICGNLQRGPEHMSHEDYVQRLAIKNPLVQVCENYIGYKTKILHKCLVHDYLWYITPLNALSGQGCKYCRLEKISSSHLKTTEQYKKEIIERNLKAIPMEEYKGVHKRIKHKYLSCGHELYTSPDSILLGSDCPICISSKGERAISAFLESQHVDFVPQYKYEGLVGVGSGLLSYDFYLPAYNLLIEYQGEQHSRDAFGLARFRIQKEHDKRKREYAKQNDVKLLEIWYYDYDKIEDILKEQLNLESVETVIEA